LASRQWAEPPSCQATDKWPDTSLRSEAASLKCFARQPLVRLQIFVARPGDNFGRELGRRRRLVPLQCLEIIADELLVEAGLAAAGPVLIGRPETRRVGRQHFVNEDQSPFVK